MPILNKVNLGTFSQMFLTHLPGLLPDVVGHSLGDPLGGAGVQVLTPPHTHSASAAALFYPFDCNSLYLIKKILNTHQTGFY